MKDLNKLPLIAESSLHNLTADDVLKQRILNAILNEKHAEKNHRYRFVVPVLCASVLLMAVLVGGLSGKNPLREDNNPSMSINSYAAGSLDQKMANSDNTELIVFINGIEFDPRNVSSIEIEGRGTVTDWSQCTFLLSVLHQKALDCNEEKSPEISTGLMTIRISDSDEFITVPFDEPLIYINGVWKECGEFFDLFNAALADESDP